MTQSIESLNRDLQAFKAAYQIHNHDGTVNMGIPVKDRLGGLGSGVFRFSVNGGNVDADGNPDILEAQQTVNNYSVYGTPTINNGVVSNFNTGCIYSPTALSYSGKDWIISTCFTTGADVLSKQAVLLFKLLSPSHGVVLSNDSYSYRKLTLFILKDGFTAGIRGNTLLQPNTTYYIKASFVLSTSRYTLLISTTGEEGSYYAECTTVGDPINYSDNLYIGRYRASASDCFLGSINAALTSADMGGTVWRPIILGDDSIKFNVGGQYLPLIFTDGNGSVFSVNNIAPLPTSGLSNGAYNVFISGNKPIAQAYDNVIFKQKEEPIIVTAGDIWFRTMAQFAAYIRTATEWVLTDLVPIGSFTISGGTIVDLKTFAYNRNRVLARSSAPDWAGKIAFSNNMAAPFDCNAYIGCGATDTDILVYITPYGGTEFALMFQGYSNDGPASVFVTLNKGDRLRTNRTPNGWLVPFKED